MCLISPDTDQGKISRALLGLEQCIPRNFSPSLQKTIYRTLEYFCIPNPTEGMHRFQNTWKGKRIQSPSVHLRVVLPTAIFKKCYHSKQFFYIHHTNHTPSALSANKNSFEQHKPMFTAPILNSNLNAANLI